ncbi:hypothetical protein Vretimale_3903 [Volvox reticuliferus]|uniref:Uncharacterized protein n=1 Tax=Volvox reticuliferus TaxID=1737510 RepID=A0A8J4BW59_9CHLO|nr:hypothetical protein Vretifemale_1506 [Volvox reticuliferus]GIL98533.1 hypothetical protein Vretimale_3903 [Volvox reticuliferus]
MWAHLRACFSTTGDESSHAAHGRKRAVVGGTAIGEGAQRNSSFSEAERRVRLGASTFDSAADSPRAITPMLARGITTDEKGFSATLLAEAPSVKPSNKTGVTSSFETVNDGQSGNTVVASAFPSGYDSTGATCKSPAEVRGARVRLLLPNDSAKISDSGGKEVSTAMATAAATPAGSRKVIGSLPLPSKADGEPRALAQLAGLLLTQHVHYRSELEAIMATHGSAFPKSLLEDLLLRHNVTLPQNRMRVIETLYRVEESQAEDGPQQEGRGNAVGSGAGSDEGWAGCVKIDGLALLKDLDRAAFRYIALGTMGEGAGGETRQVREASSAFSGVGTAANSKKNLMPSGQLGDKTRILQLVASQLANDETLRIRSGSGEDLTPAHLQEVVEQIDLTSVAIPVGTRAPYVASTEDPDSFQVPVWSLRAMQLRKQQRDRELLGSDPHLRHLGQAGREALQMQLTCRSLFQQEEIIANAVVAAARAAVAPSVRLTENSIQLAGPSRIGSLQRTGSRNSSSPQRRSATTLPAATVATNQSDGGAAGGRNEEVQEAIKGRDQDKGQVEIRDSGCGGTGSSGLNPAAIVQSQIASSSCGDSARGDASLFTGAPQLSGGGPSLMTRTCAASPSSDDAVGGVGRRGSGGGSSGSSLTSSGAALVSSHKALNTAGSGMMVVRPVKEAAPMRASDPQKPSSPSPSVLAPSPPRSPPNRESKDGTPAPGQPRPYEGGSSGAVARQEPWQVQGGLAMEAPQRVVGCVSPRSPLGRSAWEATCGEGVCTAERSSRSGSSARVGKGVSGDGGNELAAGGPISWPAVVNSTSMGASRVGPVATKSGDGRGKYAEGGPPPIPPPCARVGTPSLLRPGEDDGEPHHQSGEGLLQLPWDHEAAMLHRGSGIARSSSPCHGSNPNASSPSGSRMAQRGVGSAVSANMDDANELPGQCNTANV